MHSRMVVLLAGAMVLTAAPWIPAGRSAELTPEAHIQRAFEISGVNRTVAGLPAMFEGSMARQAAQQPPEVREAALRAGRAAFDPKAIGSAMVAAFKESYDEKILTAAIARMESPLGKRMTELEAAASAPQFQEALQAYVGTWSTTPPPRERIVLMARLDDASQGSRANTELVLVTTLAIVEGLDFAKPESQRTKPEELDQMVETMRAQLSEALRNQVIATYLYIYRDVSGEDIERYIADLESEEGNWFVVTMWNALLSAMQEAGRRMAESIVTQFQQR